MLSILRTLTKTTGVLLIFFVSLCIAILLIVAYRSGPPEIDLHVKNATQEEVSEVILLLGERVSSAYRFGSIKPSETVTGKFSRSNETPNEFIVIFSSGRTLFLKNALYIGDELLGVEIEIQPDKIVYVKPLFAE